MVPKRKNDTGETIGIWGQQSSGKSLLAIKLGVEKHRTRLLSWGVESMLYSNILLEGVEQYEYRDSNGLDSLIADIVPKDLRHITIVFDEADQKYPHRNWQSKAQYERLNRLWQVHRMDTTFIYTAHLNRGVDLTLRDATHFFVLVEALNIEGDFCEVQWIPRDTMDEDMILFTDIIKYFAYYDRWRPIQ